MTAKVKKRKITKRKRIMKYKQKQLDTLFAHIIVMNMFIILAILLSTLVGTSGNNKSEDGMNETAYESANIDHDTAIPTANVLTNLDNETTEPTTEPDIMEYDRGLSEKDKYLLAKLAMAEAEGESLEAKVLIILVVLNRVETKGFPNTIEEVIFQERNGIYQFTPIGDGRWDKVEPNAECWEAVSIVNTTNYDFSEGALYFEACSGESWHSRNLEFICQVDNTRFYR